MVSRVLESLQSILRDYENTCETSLVGGTHPVHSCSLFGVGNFVVGEDIVGASHRQPYAVFVVLERVLRHLGIEHLHQCHSSVGIAVYVVSL